MHRCRRLTALLAALTLLVAACGEAAEDELDEPDEETPDEDEEDVDEAEADDVGADVQIVTSIFTLASAAEDVASGANVELLGSSGQDPHDLELSPGDRAAVEDADVFLYLGDIDFQPQVEAAAEEAGGALVSAADAIGTDDLLDFDHDHDDEHGDKDPHVWLEPTLMAEVVVALGDALAEVDSEHAEQYEANAADKADDLAALQADIDDALSACTHDVALVGHEAWAYLLEPRGFEQEGISGAGGHGEASPQRIAELADLIEEEDIPGVFAEPVAGRDDAEALANEADVELFEVDPLEVWKDDWLDRDYEDLLMEQMGTFAEGLECDGG